MSIEQSLNDIRSINRKYSNLLDKAQEVLGCFKIYVKKMIFVN